MKLKRITLGLCAALLITLSGCASSDKRSVQKYLEERYNEKFTILDSEASADGGSAFSHNFTAFCVSESHPDCVFKTTIKGAGSGYGTFEDEYANGILCQRIQEMAEEKLGDAFGEHFLSCYLYQNNSLILSNWDDLTYEMYFNGLYPEYPNQETGSLIVKIRLDVNSDAYIPEDYGAEYDRLVHLLDEMCSELQVDANLSVTFEPELLYQREREWKQSHTANYAMPTKMYRYDDGHVIPDEYYALGWNRNEREVCAFYGSTLTTREDYIQKRTQAD